MKSINPTTGKLIKLYRETSLKDIERGLKKAHEAFEDWQNLSFERRAKGIRNAARILRKNKDKYARLIAEEMGKPLVQGQAEIEKCAWTCDFFAHEASKYLAPQIIKTDVRKSFVCFQPLGIILAVMPWNFPFWQVFRAAAPTLMAGNAMVLKHAGNVSGCALAIEEVFAKAGFPDGLFGTLLLSNQKAGDLIEHPLVQAVTLTGSTGAGK